MKAIVRADIELDSMMREVIAWQRNNPADDLLTELIQAEQHGDLLTDDELVAQVLLLYVAGHHTTVNLIGNGVTALLRHPDQLALLRSNPDLIGNAVEEFLRYDSPLHETSRITLAPYPIGGREIPAGAIVYVGQFSQSPGPHHPTPPTSPGQNPLVRHRRCASNVHLLAGGEGNAFSIVLNAGSSKR